MLGILEADVMKQQIELPIPLTPGDWNLVGRISDEERIKTYARLIAGRDLPDNQPLDFA